MARPADCVPVETIQKALADSGLSVNEVARRLGWYRTIPHTVKVRRALGIVKSGGSGVKQEAVTYNRAVQLIDAMGLDPVEYGL